MYGNDDLGADTAEGRGRRHLAREPGNHEVDPRLVEAFRDVERRQRTAAGLKHERQEVEADKGPSDCLRAQPAQLGAIHCDNASKADVYRAGVECRSDCQANEIDDEVGIVEVVVVELDSGDISHDLQRRSSQHADHESPGAVANAEDNLREEGQTENGQVERVARERGNVSQLAVISD